MRIRGNACAVLPALLLALAAGGCGDSGSAGSVAQDAASWPAPNGDAANHRRATSSIDAASVDRLRVAWRLPLAAVYASTPIVLDGVVYAQDLMSNVYAVELASGRLRWRRDYGEIDTGPNGVNVVDGRVYGATASRAFALDAESGREVWSKLLARHPGDAIDMAPGYADGTVYVSTAVAGIGAVGTLWALDADSGRARWRWRQVPEDLWGHPEVNSGGGLWHPPAFDEDGALYVSTANPLPFPGRDRWPWGSSRPGANRWTNSIVKLDPDTGELLWARQVLPHDIYDWDLQGPVILDRVGGRLLAITCGKMGFVYAFDAADGRPVWERSVGLHNGHDRDNLLVLRGRVPFTRPTKVLPGWWGGVETQMASDGRTLYVPVNDLATVYDSGTKLTPPDAAEGTGRMVALDVASGRVRWDHPLPRSPYGAATISNDLVFTTTYDGTVWALARADGGVAWRTRLRAGSNAPVVVAGDTLIAAASVPTPEQGPELVAYRLDAD
ncbi:MAG TPA: PQQ-binding-like beta-propeller repeat protein [Conexibacter sp.]|nr:PQQ-binding-like beta-propeller repeat protein [Conexibacter sp.]